MRNIEKVGDAVRDRSVLAKKKVAVTDFNKISLNGLVDHLKNIHHEFILETLPSIESNLNKASKIHKKDYPELNHIKVLFQDLSHELSGKVDETEKILFPVIRYLIHCDKFNEKPRTRGFDTVKNPINKLKLKITKIEELIHKLEGITNQFNPPSNIPSTVKLVYSEIGEFIKKLNELIHLKNNILFVRAIKLEYKLIRK